MLHFSDRGEYGGGWGGGMGSAAEICAGVGSPLRNFTKKLKNLRV